MFLSHHSFIYIGDKHSILHSLILKIEKHSNCNCFGCDLCRILIKIDLELHKSIYTCEMAFIVKTRLINYMSQPI